MDSVNSVHWLLPLTRACFYHKISNVVNMSTSWTVSEQKAQRTVLQHVYFGGYEIQTGACVFGIHSRLSVLKRTVTLYQSALGGFKVHSYNAKCSAPPFIVTDQLKGLTLSNSPRCSLPGLSSGFASSVNSQTCQVQTHTLSPFAASRLGFSSPHQLSVHEWPTGSR